MIKVYMVYKIQSRELNNETTIEKLQEIRQ